MLFGMSEQFAEHLLDVVVGVIVGVPEDDVVARLPTLLLPLVLLLARDDGRDAHAVRNVLFVGPTHFIWSFVDCHIFES